ncbi:conserved Plasmodium protein, unknown function [Plasmodium gallinaceum]|uniref:Uncharacterized protein n=1 Tax=Plasmodium gallinaceum TaxID=5849 RepID=A0A1J1GM15_PLAGA|nr:conserved Plasmodium protein, unknown function [Plasmodium gallinaceum]CRG93396.1 conserved Plasmodium protein, unknown function [Plasmodium gallinaceum]
MLFAYFLGVIEKNIIQNRFTKSKCFKRYIYTNNKKTVSLNMNELKKQLVKKLEKTNKKYFNSLKKNSYINKYNLQDEIFRNFENVNLFNSFSTQKRKSFYNLLIKNKTNKNKNENLLNINKINSKLPLLENESDKINEMLKIINANERKLNFFRNFFLINYMLIILAICSLFVLSEDIINNYIISKIEKILEEIKKSKEIENNMKEITNNLLVKILQEERNKTLTSSFLINVLKNSKKEIGDIFIEILETEHVKKKLKNIFSDISIYLCNNKNIQKNCYHLLSEAICLPAAINSSEKWLVNLFNSNFVKENLRGIIYKELFKNDEMINNSVLYLQNILYNTMQNEKTQEQTKTFFSSLISNQEFQYQLSENVWKIFKLALSPKWMNNEDFKIDIKETKKNEIKETQSNKNNLKNIKNIQNCENNIITTDKKNNDKDELHEEKNKIDVESIKEKEEKKNDIIEKKINSNNDDPFNYLNDENHLKKEIKKVIEIYENENENENDKMKNDAIYNSKNMNHSEMNKENELINNNLKGKKIEELNEIINDDILKESIKHMLEISYTLNNLKSLLFTSNFNKTKCLDIPIYKIKNFKEISKNDTLPYLNSILKNNNINKSIKCLEIENNKFYEENQLYEYSIEEKIKLAIVDMLLFYSYKYYFYYYYIIKLKSIFQNILSIKHF